MASHAGPQARHSAADRGSRIAQRRGRRGADPVRDPAAETRGMSDPSEMTSQALAAIGQAHSNTELDRIELEYLGPKSSKVSAMLSTIGRPPRAAQAAVA